MHTTQIATKLTTHFSSRKQNHWNKNLLRIHFCIIGLGLIYVVCISISLCIFQRIFFHDIYFKRFLIFYDTSKKGSVWLYARILFNYIYVCLFASAIVILLSVIISKSATLKAHRFGASHFQAFDDFYTNVFFCGKNLL